MSALTIDSATTPSPFLCQSLAALLTSRRYRYIRRARLSGARVIVDVSAAGEEDWSEQEAGESRWHAFVPSPAERELIRSWAACDPMTLPENFVVVVP